MRRLGPQQTAPVSKPDQPPTPTAETAPAPPLVSAFFHKSPIALYDLTAPIPVAGSQSQWTVFSKYDCNALEDRYQELLREEHDKEPEKEAGNQPDDAKLDDGQEQQPKLGSNSDDDLLLVGIERLHSVDLHGWKMKPVYWTSRNASATFTSVRRGTWFYASDSLPVEDDVAATLERGYHEVKPWTMAYEAELEAAGELGASAEAKLKYNIGEDSSGQYIIYRNSKAAWIGSRSLGSKLVRSIYSTIGRSRKEAFVEVFRGYDFRRPHPVAKVSRDHSPAPNGSKRRSTSLPRAPEKLKDIQGEYAKDDEEDGIPKAAEVSDLILVIHGIGQKLAETSEGWTFTHAVTRLRLLLHEQMIHKDVHPCLRENFCPQVLPINWRVNFDPDAPETHKSDNADKGSPAFSLDDITIDAIPAVRDLIGKVVFDIPYYMSHHKPRMIEAVVKEANRIYALWLRNNKSFETNAGRVHIICHSLGSAISFDVLSNQPNDVKARSSLFNVLTGSLDSRATKIREGPSHFNFNTTNLICAGSPAAFFLLLKQKHLVPRKRMKADKALSRDSNITAEQGDYGCLAAKEIYNVFYATDPIAYRMNPTIDSDFANSLPPTQIPSAAAPFFSSLKLPFSGSSTSQATSAERPELRNLPSQVELETHDFERETAADRRLQLLNENGSLDYVLPMSGYIDNQYLSMVYAHQGYWDSKEFARLVVIECGRSQGDIVYKGHKSSTRLESAVSSGK